MVVLVVFISKYKHRNIGDMRTKRCLTGRWGVSRGVLGSTHDKKSCNSQPEKSDV